MKSNGDVSGVSAVTSVFTTRPVLYLSSDIKLSGTGTNDDPFETKSIYPIQVRVTDKINQTDTSDTTEVTLKELETPTYNESETDNGKDVTITYPSGCGDTLTCTYSKDSGSDVTVTSTTATVSFTESGNVVAKVSDGTNEVSSSYTVSLIKNLSDVLTIQNYETEGAVEQYYACNTVITLNSSISNIPLQIKWYYNSSETTDISSSTLYDTTSSTSSNTTISHSVVTSTTAYYYYFAAITDSSGGYSGTVITEPIKVIKASECKTIINK